jgi:ABC-2 type transport system ATP-binding protein
MGEAAVRVRGLRRRFGDFWAVDGVDLGVAAGEILGLLGPNGAGKSTVIRMICGLLLPTAGEISVAGIDPVHNPLAVKARIGYMTQHFSLYADLTVAENLSFYGAMYGLRGRALSAALGRWSSALGLGDYMQRPIGEMPPGCRRRAAFACAVIAEPPVLLLDEPTSGVDLQTSDLLWRLCARQAARGAAVLVTTHSMAEAERCERVCILAAGRIVGVGTPRGLADGLRGYMLGVEAGPLGTSVEALKAWPGARAVAVVGRMIRVEVTGALSDAEPQARRAVEQAGGRVTAVRAVEPTLDDVFVHLVTAPPCGAGVSPADHFAAGTAAPPQAQGRPEQGRGARR